MKPKKLKSPTRQARKTSASSCLELINSTCRLLYMYDVSDMTANTVVSKFNRKECKQTGKKVKKKSTLPCHNDLHTYPRRCRDAYRRRRIMFRNDFATCRGQQARATFTLCGIQPSSIVDFDKT